MELDDIDAQLGGNAAEAEDEYEETTDDYDDCIERASQLFKKTAVLLQYLGDENFCKSITKRERTIIAKHVDSIYDFNDELEHLLAANGDD